MPAELLYLFRFVIGNGEGSGVDFRTDALNKPVSTFEAVQLVAVTVLGLYGVLLRANTAG